MSKKQAVVKETPKPVTVNLKKAVAEVKAKAEKAERKGRTAKVYSLPGLISEMTQVASDFRTAKAERKELEKFGLSFRRLARHILNFSEQL